MVSAIENDLFNDDTCSIFGSNEFKYELLRLRLNEGRFEVGLNADDRSSFFGQERCNDGLDGKTVLRFGILQRRSTDRARKIAY